MIGGPAGGRGPPGAAVRGPRPRAGGGHPDPGRQGDPAPEELGYLHCGPARAGHFVKMIHNGIEYGIMAAYAEGLNILHHANAGKRAEEASAEAAPLRDPGSYRYDLDVAAVAELWRRGSVIGSWLLDLTAHALAQDPKVAGFSGRVSDSGEGRWTVAAAVETGVPAHVLTHRPVRAVRLPRAGRLRRQAAVGHAQGVRRPRGAPHRGVTGPAQRTAAPRASGPAARNRSAASRTATVSRPRRTSQGWSLAPVATSSVSWPMAASRATR